LLKLYYDTYPSYKYDLICAKGKLGTDESKFMQILCSRSFQQLSATFAAYIDFSKNDIEKAIKNEMSGDLEKACLALGKNLSNIFLIKIAKKFGTSFFFDFFCY
jgi:hypothetical protein